MKLFVLSLLIFSVSVFANSKKNLCSVTINSDNEVQTFKKHLSPDLWNFIELVPDQYNAENRNFLRSYCRKDISCDVLIISGHFSGTFIGSTGWSLPIENMERMSCDATCDGIFKKPKEVFLFGCNTLSQRDSTEANPVALLQHLENRGFSRLQAAQVMEFRATQFGNDMKDRMRAIFPNTSAIYGFGKIAPTGPQIQPYLDKYLNDSNLRYNSTGNFTAIDSAGNTTFRNSLALKSVLIAEGLRSTNEFTKPYCHLGNPNYDPIKKLDLIEKLFNQNMAIQSIRHIENAISSIRGKSLDKNTVDERLRRISALPSTRSTLQKILALQGEPFILFKGTTLKAMNNLNLIDYGDFFNQSLSLLELNKPFSKIKADLICGTELRINLTLKDIPSARWSEENFINALGCIKPTDSAIYVKLLALTKSLPKDSLMRSSVFAILSGRQNYESKIQLQLVQTLEDEVFAANRQLIAMAIANSKPIFPGIRSKLALIANSEKNPLIRQQLEKAIAN